MKRLFKDTFVGEYNARERICSEDELARLLAAASGDLKLLIALAFWTGCRAGELASLEWKRIDLARGLISLEAKRTKTGEARKVPIADAATLDALRVRKAAADEAKKDARDADDPARGRVFEVKGSSTFSSGFAKLTKKLKIEDLRLHDLRHSALTRYRKAGLDLLTLQAISGHKSLAMLARYNKTDDDDLLLAAQRMSQVRT